LAFRKILVAIDQHSSSLQAADLAAALAREAKSQVTLVHVIPPSAEVPEGTSGMDFSPTQERNIAVPTPGGDASETEREMSRDLDRRAEAIISDAKAIFDREGVEVRSDIVRYREPGRAILDLAEEGWYDLLVLGNGGDDHWELDTAGSVAHEVVKNAMTSVLLVKREAGFGSVSAYVTKEDSPVMGPVMRISGVFDSQLDIIVGKDKEAEAEMLLRNLLQRAADAGLSPGGAIVKELDLESIEEAIGKNRSQLLILERPNPGALGRLVKRGGWLSKLVDVIPCSLLLVRRKREE